MPRTMDIPCSHCGELFTVPWKKRYQQYCGHTCKGQARFTKEYNTALARDPQAIAKRASKLRGRGEGKAYRKLNGRHTHRVIMEDILGRPLVKGEIVHHKDGNILNNAPENLEVLPSQSAHCKEHDFGHQNTLVDLDRIFS